MQAEARSEPFTGVDHAWLRMESSVNPMVITALIVLDGPVEAGRFEAMIEERLLPHPRFRQRPVGGTLIGTPRWEFDSRFDIKNHVFREKLPPPGGRAWLEARVAELFGKPMDHARPLWDMRLIEGYEGGTAVIIRLHHCIADGMALLRVLVSLTDAAEGAAVHAVPPRPGGARGVSTRDLPRSPGELLEAARKLYESREELLEQARALLAPESREKARHLAKRGAEGVASLGRLLFLPPDPPTPLRGKLSGRKAASWTDPIPVADLKAVGKRAGATVNDVLQSCIAGAFRRYLEGRGHSPQGLDLRSVVTMDLRPPDRPVDAGNYFGLVFLELPVGIADPVKRLRETKRRMDRIKASPEAVAIYALLKVMGFASARIEEAALKIFGSKASAIMTNVPGPKEPRRMAGQEIRDILFWVPESGGIGIGISFFAYRGRIRVGIITDAALVPDPGKITLAFHEELAKLQGLPDGDFARTGW